MIGRDVLDDASLTAEELVTLLDLAEQCDEEAKTHSTQRTLQGRTIACIFEKASSRTRLAVEIAAARQGAHTVFLDGNSHLGHKESVADTVRLLSGTCDAIVYRGSEQATLELMASVADVPVFNMLTDDWHPTQMFADILTMRRNSTKELKDISYAFVGDGRCNVANSQLLTGAVLGMDVRIIAPTSLQPTPHVWEKAQRIAVESGARLTMTDDVDFGLAGVDFVSTDVWVSMGEADAAWQERIELLMPYRVTKELLELTQNRNVKFLHCLPAFHDADTEVGARIARASGLLDGIEVTDEVFRSPASLVWEQAAARVCTTEALFRTCIA
jgi:ornithine carbamoyltransferase